MLPHGFQRVVKYPGNPLIGLASGTIGKAKPRRLAITAGLDAAQLWHSLCVPQNEADSMLDRKNQSFQSEFIAMNDHVTLRIRRFGWVATGGLVLLVASQDARSQPPADQAGADAVAAAQTSKDAPE